MSINYKRSNPVDYIQTANNPDWTVTQAGMLFDGTVVSSQPMTELFSNPSAGQLGIQPSLDEGELQLIRLNFNLAIDINDITTPLNNPAVPTQTIPYSAGLVILANNLIKLDREDNPSLETAIADTTQWFRYDYKSSTLASFLQLTIGAQKISGLLNTCSYKQDETAGQYNQFAVTNAQIKFHSSIYADEHLLDFYIGTFDQMESSYPVFKNSFLTNAYTITSPRPSQIRLGIANYFTSISQGNTGEYIPTVLRIAGYFSQSELENASTKISLFFRNMVPFYKSEETEQKNEVFCRFTGLTQPICTYHASGLLSRGQSYMNFERIDVEFESIPTNPDDAFQLLIPLKNSANAPTTTVFLGATVNNPLYSGSGFVQLRAVYRLTGGNNLNQEQYSFTLESTPMGTGYKKPGIIIAPGEEYQMQTSGMNVGANSTQLIFRIGHSDSNNVILINSQTNNHANGGAFTLTSSAQFDTADSIFRVPISITNRKVSQCVSFQYYSSFFNAVPTVRYVIFCPFDSGSESTTTLLTISSANLPFVNGEKLPARTAYAWSDATRGMGSMALDTKTVIPNQGILKLLGTSNGIAIRRLQQQISWRFISANPIPAGATVKIEFVGAIYFIRPINAGSRCQFEAPELVTFGHTCTVAAVTDTATPYFQFKITNCDACPLPAGQITVHQWGIDESSDPLDVNKNVNGKQIQYHIRVLSEQLNTIDVSKVSSSISFFEGPAPQIFLGNTVFQFYNRRARGMMQIDFQPSRSIWKQEYILLDLGAVLTDNYRNKENLWCQVLGSNSQPSILWKEADYTLDRASSINGIKLYPRVDIVGSQPFIFKCNGVIFPFTFNPKGMSASLVVQNTFTVVENSGNALVAIDTLLPNAETSFPLRNIQLSKKSNNVGGSQTDIIIQFISTLLDIKLGTTIFVVFPTTYPVTVSSNLTYCSLNEVFVACSLSAENTIILENFDISIPKLTTARLRVFGAQQSGIFNSQSNEIFVGLTNNKDLTILTEYGVAYDLSPQDMILTPPKAISIQKMDFTDNFIRTMNQLTFKVQFPPGAIDMNNIIQVDFPPAWDMIINYKLPTCTLFDFDNKTNYAANCTNFGNRVTISINQTDFIGSTFYYLTLGKVRNPDFSVCGINKWTLTVLKSDGSFVYGRSHPPNFNVQHLPFVSNPAQLMLKFIDPETRQDIRTINVKTGVLMAKLALAAENGVFIRSFQIYNTNAYFIADPLNINAPMGHSFAAFSIAGTNKAPQGLQLIEFAKTDDFDRHTPLPFLRIFLQQQTYPLRTETNLYTLAIGGQAPPILFNLTDNLPTTNLRIEATISTDRVYFKSKSSVTFGPLSGRVNAFIIAAEDSGVVVGDSGIVDFKVQGIYEQYYTSLDSVSFRIVESIKRRPMINLQAIGTERGPDYVTFAASCTQYGTIYYSLSINGSEILYSEDIYNRAVSFPEPSILDYYHQIFGIRNVLIANQQQIIIVSGLRPATIYNITAVCLNVDRKYSVAASVLQSTKSNNGRSFYLDFSFESPIDIDFSDSITCFLALQFKVPARLVRNSANSWCDYQRRRRLLQEDLQKNYSESNVRIYIGLIDFEKEDKITQAVFASKLNKTKFISDLYKTVAGLPNLVKLSDFMPMSTVQPLFVEESNIKLNYTQNTASLSNIEIDQEGFVYAMLDWQNRSRFPSFYDIRVGNQYRKQFLKNLSITTETAYFMRQRFNKSQPLTFNFEKLTHYTNYTIFLYAANDDPTEFQLRSYVRNFDFTTEPIYKIYAYILSVGFLMIII